MHREPSLALPQPVQPPVAALLYEIGGSANQSTTTTVTGHLVGKDEAVVADDQLVADG